MNNNEPYSYAEINVATFPVVPSTAHAHNTAIAEYYRRYLFQRAMSVFQWEYPAEWDLLYMLEGVYKRGFLAVIDTNRYGVVPQWATPSGFNVFRRAISASISSDLIEQKEWTIGEKCLPLYMTYTYCGIADIVNYYADMMATAAEAAAVNTSNSKTAIVFTVGSKQAAETFKKAVDKIQSGEPAIWIDKMLASEENESWRPFIRDVGSSYIADKLIRDLRTWESMFNADVGIPSANIDKRERLTDDEVHSGEVATSCKAALWLDTLQKCCNDINDAFGRKMSHRLWVDWRYKTMAGGVDNGAVVADGPVSV